MQRVVPGAEAKHVTKLQATGSYQPEEGWVDFETTEATAYVQRIRVSARLARRQRVAPVKVEETRKGDGATIKHEALLFLDESRDFWTNLEWMSRCRSEALATIN
jgi:hypothetical protein